MPEQQAGAWERPIGRTRAWICHLVRLDGVTGEVGRLKLFRSPAKPLNVPERPRAPGLGYWLVPELACTLRKPFGAAFQEGVSVSRLVILHFRGLIDQR